MAGFEELMNYCEQNGISIAGASDEITKGDRGSRIPPYISFDFNGQNLGAIANIVSQMENDKGVTFSFSNDVDHDGNQTKLMQVSFDGVFRGQEPDFAKVLEACESREGVQLDDMSPVMQNILAVMNNADKKLSIQKSGEMYSMGLPDPSYVEPIMSRYDEEDAPFRQGNELEFLTADKIEEMLLTVAIRMRVERVSCGKLITGPGILNETLLVTSFEDNQKDGSISTIEPRIGANLREVAAEIIRLQQQGYATRCSFNGIEIVSVEYSSPEELIKGYNEKAEQKRETARTAREGKKEREGQDR